MQNALFKIAAKQCLSLLMMLDFDDWGRGGVGEGAECLFKIAMKQYLGLLIIIEGGGRTLYLRYP